MRPVMPHGPIPARTMIVGEAPGAEEERVGRPFVGASGYELDRMLLEAGINRSECFVTNVARFRPPSNDISLWMPKTKKAQKELLDAGGTHLFDRVVHHHIADGVRLLQFEVEQCRPAIIIALGNTSLWALTGKSSITEWRGSVLPCTLDTAFKVLATYHPAAILRQWSWRPVMLHDLRRAGKESEFEGITSRNYRFITSPSFPTTLSTLSALWSYAHATPFPNQPSAPNPIPNPLGARLLDMEGRLQLEWCGSPPPASGDSPPLRSNPLMDALRETSYPLRPPLSSPKLPPEQLPQPGAPLRPVDFPSEARGSLETVRAAALNLPAPPLGDVLPSNRREPPHLHSPSHPRRPHHPPTLKLACDIETRTSHITCLGLAWDIEEGICIPFTCAHDRYGYWSLDEETLIVCALMRLLTSPAVGIIGQNFIYDAQYIYRSWHFIPNFYRDTMLAQHVCFPGMPKSLDFIASMHCEHYVQWKGEARELFKVEGKPDD